MGLESGPLAVGGRPDAGGGCLASGADAAGEVGTQPGQAMARMAGAMGGFEVDHEDEEGEDRHEQNVDDARASSRGCTT